MSLDTHLILGSLVTHSSRMIEAIFPLVWRLANLWVYLTAYLARVGGHTYSWRNNDTQRCLEKKASSGLTSLYSSFVESPTPGEW